MWVEIQSSGMTMKLKNYQICTDINNNPGENKKERKCENVLNRT